MSARGGRLLDGVGHGTLLAGRYRLEECIRSGPDGSLWRGVDETLDRPVSVRLLRPGHRHTADVVDAARRAALVEDRRLVRVLDVGESADSAHIVAEHLLGRTLEQVLAAGPLPPDVARRLVGESAQALERASARGLHHLRLSPSSLVITPDGAVKVLGTAVDAALAGLEQDADPVGADRTDARGLVRILYAALTARWPGTAESTLEPAPRADGRAVPPGDLVTGVPNDLDTLCVVALGPLDDGPQSPRELAAQLAPWGSAEPLPAPAVALAGEGVTAAGADPQTATSADLDPPAPAATGANGLAPHTLNCSVAAPDPGGEWPWRLPVETGEVPSRVARVPAAAAAVPGRGRTAAPDLTSSVPPGGSVLHPAPGSSSPSVDEWALLGNARPEPWPSAGGDRPAPSEEEEVPLGPFIPPAPLSRPSRDQTRLVIALVAGLVVLGLVLAVLGLIGMGRPAPLVQQGPVILPTATTGAASPALGAGTSASPTPTDSPTGSPSPSMSGDVATIAGDEAIDPQGDGQEGSSLAPRAIDGDPDTGWRSDRYRSADFGGLKQGLGLYLRLNAGRVNTVTVSMPGTGGTVELRTAVGPGLDSSTVVATAQAQNGVAVLTPARPMTLDSLLLWFTSVPQQGNGEYRIIVNEIMIS
ncbi:MAG TPA: hypothetical protein VI248_03585 [Kineosporiaceae bacterium]